MREQARYFLLLRDMARFARQGIDQNLFLASNRTDRKNFNRPGAWVPAEYWDVDQRADFRTILWNEVVFDFDYPLWTHNVSAALRLLAYFRRTYVPHYLWMTGGKGYHISVFLDAHGHQKIVDWTEIRAEVYNHLSLLAGVRSDSTRVYWGDGSMGGMLRMEGGQRLVRPDLVTHDEARDGWVASYKYWTMRPQMERNLTVHARDVHYPGSLAMYSVPSIFLPNEEMVRRQREYHSSREIPDVIFRLVSFMANGGNLNDFGRMAVAKHLLAHGWDFERVVDVYRGTPNFKEWKTRERLETILQGGVTVRPGAKAIEAHCVEALAQ